MKTLKDNASTSTISTSCVTECDYNLVRGFSIVSDDDKCLNDVGDDDIGNTHVGNDVQFKSMLEFLSILKLVGGVSDNCLVDSGEDDDVEDLEPPLAFEIDCECLDLCESPGENGVNDIDDDLEPPLTFEIDCECLDLCEFPGENGVNEFHDYDGLNVDDVNYDKEIQNRLSRGVIDELISSHMKTSSNDYLNYVSSDSDMPVVKVESGCSTSDTHNQILCLSPKVISENEGPFNNGFSRGVLKEIISSHLKISSNNNLDGDSTSSHMPVNIESGCAANEETREDQDNLSPKQINEIKENLNTKQDIKVAGDKKALLDELLRKRLNTNVNLESDTVEAQPQNQVDLSPTPKNKGYISTEKDATRNKNPFLDELLQKRLNTADVKVENVTNQTPYPINSFPKVVDNHEEDVNFGSKMDFLDELLQKRLSKNVHQQPSELADTYLSKEKENGVAETKTDHNEISLDRSDQGPSTRRIKPPSMLDEIIRATSIRKQRIEETSNTEGVKTDAVVAEHKRSCFNELTTKRADTTKQNSVCKAGLSLDQELSNVLKRRNKVQQLELSEKPESSQSVANEKEIYDKKLQKEPVIQTAKDCAQGHCLKNISVDLSLGQELSNVLKRRNKIQQLELSEKPESSQSVANEKEIYNKKLQKESVIQTAKDCAQIDSSVDFKFVNCYIVKNAQDKSVENKKSKTPVMLDNPKKIDNEDSDIDMIPTLKLEPVAFSDVMSELLQVRGHKKERECESSKSDDDDSLDVVKDEHAKEDKTSFLKELNAKFNNRKMRYPVVGTSSEKEDAHFSGRSNATSSSKSPLLESGNSCLKSIDQNSSYDNVTTKGVNESFDRSCGRDKENSNLHVEHECIGEIGTCGLIDKTVHAKLVSNRVPATISVADGLSLREGCTLSEVSDDERSSFLYLEGIADDARVGLKTDTSISNSEGKCIVRRRNVSLSLKDDFSSANEKISKDGNKVKNKSCKQENVQSSLVEYYRVNSDDMLILVANILRIVFWIVLGFIVAYTSFDFDR